MKYVHVLLCVIFAQIIYVSGHNKYSKEANNAKLPDDIAKINFKTLEKPFRMHKINILWAKAQHVSQNLPLTQADLF